MVTVKVVGLDVFPLGSVAVRVKLYVPEVVGVPESSNILRLPGGL